MQGHPSAERPLTVRYQLSTSMQKQLLRLAHARSRHGVADLTAFYEASGMTHGPGTFVVLDVRSHVLTVRNAEGDRSLVALCLEEWFHAPPRRLTTRSSEQAGR